MINNYRLWSQGNFVRIMGLLPDTQNCRLRMRWECRETFSRDARAVTHVGIAHLQWRGKRSRHSRRMRTGNFAYLAWVLQDALLDKNGPEADSLHLLVTQMNRLVEIAIANNSKSHNAVHEKCI